MYMMMYYITAAPTHTKAGAFKINSSLFLYTMTWYVQITFLIWPNLSNNNKSINDIFINIIVKIFKPSKSE